MTIRVIVTTSIRATDEARNGLDRTNLGLKEFHNHNYIINNTQARDNPIGYQRLPSVQVCIADV